MKERAVLSFYYILNSAFIFSMALGANTMGEASTAAMPRPHALGYSIVFAPAHAQANMAINQNPRAAALQELRKSWAAADAVSYPSTEELLKRKVITESLSAPDDTRGDNFFSPWLPQKRSSWMHDPS
jgi:hypothetical protein